MADLVQDARWGRVMESTGEDPYLNGVLASAMIRGYQGKNDSLSEKGKIAACLKHFAGYVSPQGGRDYNTVELSERTLRDEMGFSGVLISDWMALSELITHGIAANDEQAAKLAIHAGVDIDMASPVYIKNIKSLIEQNQIPLTLIGEAVLRILTLKNNLGLFENPYKDASEADDSGKTKKQSLLLDRSLTTSF